MLSATTLITRTNGSQAVDDDFNDRLGVKSDREAAQKVMELYPHWVCCKEVLYVFDMKTGMWSDKQNVHLSVLGDLEEHLHLIAFDEKKMEWKRYARSYGNDSVFAKKMIPFLKSMCINDDWIMRNATSSLGKLLFANGYLDSFLHAYR